MREEMRRLGFKGYLGDGVYAGWDGYYVVLWLETTGAFGPDAIALDPSVLEALEVYKEKIKEGGEEDDQA